MIKLIGTVLAVFFISFLSPLLAEIQLEFRTAAFFPSSHRFRNLYENVGPTYQIEAHTQFCSCFETWANLDYFSKHGHVKHCCSGKTKIEIFNVSLGLNYIFPICCYLDTYVGIGSSLASVELKDKSCCSHDRKSKTPVGIVVKTGLRYYMEGNYFLDIFADYLYQPVHFHRRVDVGGFKTGAGIGRQF